MQSSAQKSPKTCGDLWANISSGTKIYGPISADARRSEGKYQQKCEVLLWANIRRCAIRTISADMQRSAAGKYQMSCEDYFANISRYAKICGQISEVGQISEDVGRSVGTYQQMCEDLWANCSRRAKICG